MTILAIDATNLTEGGGITHIKEILSAVEPGKYGFEKVIVYAADKTLQKIADKSWLHKKSHPLLNGGLVARSRYLFFHFKKQLEQDRCDILFNPGGAYSGSFRPYVTMCRNMLVFDEKERRRYRYTRIFWRLRLLELLQSASMRSAKGVIFISQYAASYVTKKIGLSNKKRAIINHGISDRFAAPVKPQQSVDTYTAQHPFTFLYVSIVDLYKHQWQVAKAVSKLRRKDGFNVQLELVGAAYPPAMQKLDDVLDSTDSRDYIHYKGSKNYEELHTLYHKADAFVFASSCENMPNILFEAMNAGLPLASSSSDPMPEFLKDAGWYFDPESSESIYTALKEMLLNREKRAVLAQKAKDYAHTYSWKKCADETFHFLQELAEKNKG